MPTKARRQREKERQKDWVGIPIVPLTERNPNPFAGALEGLPRGGLLAVDGAELCLCEAIGTGGNQARHADAFDTAKALAAKYKDRWMLRGTAKVIAAQERVSVETIRRYMRITRELLQAKGRP